MAIVMWGRFTGNGLASFPQNSNEFRLFSQLSILPLLGVGLGTGMLIAASASMRSPWAMLTRWAVVIYSGCYGILHAVFCNGLYEQIHGRPGLAVLFTLIGAMAWGSLAVLPTALRAANAADWRGPVAAAAPYLAGLVPTIIASLAPGAMPLSWGSLALERSLMLTADGGGGLLMLWLAAQGVLGTVESGRWIAERAVTRRGWVIVALTFLGGAGIFYIVRFTTTSVLFAGYAALMAIFAVGVLRAARWMDVPDEDQPTLAWVLVVLLFGPTLSVRMIGPPLIFIPMLVYYTGAFAATIVLLVSWLGIKRRPGRHDRGWPLVMRVTSFALAAVAGMTTQSLTNFSWQHQQVEGQVQQALGNIFDLLYNILSLGMKDNKIGAGVIFVGIASAVMVLRSATRTLGLAGLFVFLWDAPMMWGFSPASSGHFAVFMIFLLGILLILAWKGRNPLGIAPVTMLMALWTLTWVVYVARFPMQLTPDQWGSFTTPLAFTTPVLVPFLLQAQQFNNSPHRRTRILTTAGIGTALASFALFSFATGGWGEAHAEMSFVAAVYMTTPFAVVMTASAVITPEAAGVESPSTPIRP